MPRCQCQMAGTALRGPKVQFQDAGITRLQQMVQVHYKITNGLHAPEGVIPDTSPLKNQC